MRGGRATRGSKNHAIHRLRDEDTRGRDDSVSRELKIGQGHVRSAAEYQGEEGSEGNEEDKKTLSP